MFQTVVPLHLKTFEPLKRNEQNDPTSRFEIKTTKKLGNTKKNCLKELLI
jgi:hypothetical protein